LWHEREGGTSARWGKRGIEIHWKKIISISKEKWFDGSQHKNPLLTHKKFNHNTLRKGCLKLSVAWGGRRKRNGPGKVSEKPQKDLEASLNQRF